MLVGYMRISADKQTIKNQRFGILNFADRIKWVMNKWGEETVRRFYPENPSKKDIHQSQEVEAQ